MKIKIILFIRVMIMYVLEINFNLVQPYLDLFN